MLTATCITFLLFAQSVRSAVSPGGILFPRDSETRQTLSLDGIWNFVVSPITDPLVGFRELWYKKELGKLKNDLEVHQMPVPASYNDITTDPKIRDHLGLVWYDRTFFVPRSWANATRTWIRFSSVSYAAQVWINGELVMSHEIGHLPFQKEITSFLNFGGNNRITVACDNTLLADTIPQGYVKYLTTDSGKVLNQYYTFDFFNYAGIHRPVTLFTTPYSYIDDISVLTDIDGDAGIVHYNVSYVVSSDKEKFVCHIKLFDKEGDLVAQNGVNGFIGTLNVPSVNFWWPYLMDSDPGYLYSLEVNLVSVSTGEVVDIYRLPIGIRTISWTNTSLLINNRPVYLKGFGRHEDSDIRGKGLDLPTVLRDYNLIKWIGANAYRTSHYPYADEIMDLADQQGIMIIDECPGVDTDVFSASLLEKHKDSLTELIRRDKNHPSVIVWSVSNEPRGQNPLADEYFRQIVQHVKSLDRTRPTTIAISSNVELDGKHLDIISFNRYNAWYSNPGHLETITENVIAEAVAWNKKHNKPVLMSEYGADTMEGMHFVPAYIWSEDYQVQLLSKHFKAFDQLRKKGFFVGEFIWNFADFKTAQSEKRVGGNKKGLFTRNRQPKASAYVVRQRYWALASQLWNTSLPEDLHTYVAEIHDEL
ncbi:beta-glucuronidase [Rhyzopertha dominica]|nr:beta-glucuronidase [Rhyzopertha dominica]